MTDEKPRRRDLTDAEKERGVRDVVVGEMLRRGPSERYRALLDLFASTYVFWQRLKREVEANPFPELIRAERDYRRLLKRMLEGLGVEIPLTPPAT